MRADDLPRNPRNIQRITHITTDQLILTTTDLLLHHTLSILKGRTFQVPRLRSPEGLHSTNPDRCLSVHWSNQMTTVFNCTLLQIAERQKPKRSLRSSGQRIVTRTSRPSLTSCRTSELTGRLLPFLLPHDPATLGTGSHSDLPGVPNRRHSVFNSGTSLDTMASSQSRTFFFF